MDLPKPDKLKQDIAELVAQMSDPQISRDPARMKDLTAQHKHKEKLLSYVSRYDEICREIEQTNQLLKEGNSEIEQMAQEDLTKLEQEKQKLLSELEDVTTPKDPRDARNVILEIRAGAGGDEAGLFATELMRSYIRYAEKNGWKMNILGQSLNEQGGYKEVIAECSGENVFGTLKFERGVHRVQRIPETEKQGRVHTSTITVAVLPQAEEIDIEIKNEDLRIDTYRASGAGGQHVNKTSSAVRITHLPTNTVVAVQEARSQHKNKAKAMNILRARLLEKEEEKREKAKASDRKKQVGSGERSEKIRTYNYPQDRITDHRIKKNWSNIEAVMNGEWEQIFSDLKEAEKEANKVN